MNQNAQKHPITESQKSPQTLNEQESFLILDKLLKGYGTPAKKPKAVRNHCIALLMLDAGLRVGEVVRLRWNDLFFSMQPVTALVIRAEISKGKTDRTIPISRRLKNSLADYHELFSGAYVAVDSYYAFYHKIAAHPITARQVERIIRQASLKSIGRAVHPHVLRHTFASRLMRKVNARIVQELLGHKQLSSTQIYTHPNGEDLRKAIDKLNGPCEESD